MNPATFAENQKISCTRTLTAGNKQDKTNQGKNDAESREADGLNAEKRMLRHADRVVETDRGEEKKRDAGEK